MLPGRLLGGADRSRRGQRDGGAGRVQLRVRQLSLVGTVDTPYAGELIGSPQLVLSLGCHVVTHVQYTAVYMCVVWVLVYLSLTISSVYSMELT